MPDKNLSVSGELLNFRPYSRGQAFAHPGNGPRWPGEEILQETLGIEQFRKHCGLKKIARCGFPWEKTTKRPVASPDFLRRSTGREQLCATFFTESRMEFRGSTNLYRKSGFGLHQLRNCSNAPQIQASGGTRRREHFHFYSAQSSAAKCGFS